MRGLRLGLGTSRPVVASGGPVGPLWSAATTGAIADAAAWTQTGAAVVIVGGAMVFTAATTSSLLTLTGAYATAFLAAVPISTAFSRVEVDIAGWVSGPSVRMAIYNGGTGFGPYGSVSGNGTQSFPMTGGSSTGLPLRVTGLTATPYTYTITDIRIYA